VTDPYRVALDEIAAVTDRLDAAAVESACAMIAAARTVAVAGCGREALQIRGFAMRLHHLGVRVGVAGETTAPRLGPGDLLVATAGPGELATVTALMGVARGAGARVLLLTAVPETPAAALADAVLAVPAQTMASDRAAGASAVLPMGSAYEGALFVLFEVMVLKLRDRLGVTPEAMRARHTNLE
jgi:6-phospho-3-hexuloisomerase